MCAACQANGLTELAQRKLTKVWMIIPTKSSAISSYNTGECDILSGEKYKILGSSYNHGTAVILTINTKITVASEAASLCPSTWCRRNREWKPDSSKVNGSCSINTNESEFHSEHVSGHVMQWIWSMDCSNKSTYLILHRHRNCSPHSSTIRSPWQGHMHYSM